MDPLFQVHKLNEDGLGKAKAVAENFYQLLTNLTKLCPAGREFSIVRTKLEEACFFAKKALANLPANQISE